MLWNTINLLYDIINVHKYNHFIHHHSNLSPGIHLYKTVQNIQRKMNLSFQEKTAVDYPTVESNRRQWTGRSIKIFRTHIFCLLKKISIFQRAEDMVYHYGAFLTCLSQGPKFNHQYDERKSWNSILGVGSLAQWQNTEKYFLKKNKASMLEIMCQLIKTDYQGNL